MKELYAAIFSLIFIAGFGVLAHFVLKHQYNPQPPKQADTPDDDIYNN